MHDEGVGDRRFVLLSHVRLESTAPGECTLGTPWGLAFFGIWASECPDPPCAESQALEETAGVRCRPRYGLKWGDEDGQATDQRRLWKLARLSSS